MGNQFEFRSVYYKIINSVLAAGLYYGFLSAFSIKTSHLLLLRTLVFEEEEETKKRIVAKTGLIMGQILLFISIYYKPFHIALTRPRTITALGFFYIFFQIFWKSQKRVFANQNSMSNLSCIFLNHLILQQLLNTCILPSSAARRLVNIYAFRSNNKMLFVTSSFFAWFIGQILVCEFFELAGKHIRIDIELAEKHISQNRSKNRFKNRSKNRFIRSRSDYFHFFFVILFFMMSLHSFGRIPSPILLPKMSDRSQIETRALRLKGTDEEEENDQIDEEIEQEMEEIEQEIEEIEQQRKLANHLKKKKDREKKQGAGGHSDKEVHSNSNNWYSKSKIEVLTSEMRVIKEKEKKNIMSPLLFDYRRWHRPFRYIQNNRLEQAIRNEMSQYFFDTQQSDGKERISFTYPRSLSTFLKMIKRKINILLEKTLSNELDNAWVSRNKKKMNHLKNDFFNRINHLDKEKIDREIEQEKEREQKAVEILETRTRLCIQDDKTKQEYYLPQMYDPFLNGPYRGKIKKELPPSKNTLIADSRETGEQNRLHDLLLPNSNNKVLNSNYENFDQNTIEIGDILEIDAFSSIVIDKISKKVPRWSYKLISELQQLSFHYSPPVEHEIRSRRVIGEYILFDPQKTFTTTKATDKETKTNASKETDTVDKETKTNASKETDTVDKETKTNASKETDTIDKETKPDANKETDTIDKETKPDANKETDTIDKETKPDANKETDTIDKETKPDANKETPTVDKETKTKTPEEEAKEDEERGIVLMRYGHQPDFRHGLIKGSMRTQRRKIVIEKLFQANAHSPLFFDRKKKLFSFAIPRPVQLNRIFRNWLARKGFRILESTDEQTKREEKPKRESKKKSERVKERKRLEIAEAWDIFELTQTLRGCILIAQSSLRKNLILPSLIIGKNLGRMLLLQSPEWSEDFEEWNREKHIKCTYTGNPFSETEFPENWLIQGIQIKILYPFHLKPWHTSKSLTSRDDVCFLTIFGRETELPFGSPRKTPSFFEPILKELEKKIEKYEKVTAESVLKKIKLFKKVSKETRTTNQNLPFIKKIEKDLSKGKPIFLFRSREIGGMEKEKDSRISNQIINESFSQIQKIQIPDWTNSSLIEIETKMQDMTDRTSAIKNQIERITEEKKKVTLKLDISTYKKSCRLELSKKIWQSVKIKKIICKFHYFRKFLILLIYKDFILYNIRIRQMKTRRFLESIKNLIEKYISKNETNKKIMNKKTKNTIHFISNIKTYNSCKKNSEIFCDLSNLSQAYVFYKISQTGVVNLSKLRSVLQHHGTSFFLKTQMKDSFRTQGIFQSEVIHKKLQRSITSQWKNWLRGNYQYDLSQIIWSSLMSQKQKWRNRVNRYCRSQKKDLKKWNSCGKYQLSHYKKKKGLNSLSNQKDNFQKCYRYDLLSYKSINNENKGDSVFYRSIPQVTKRQAVSDNYNMSQNSLFAITGNIPINIFIGRIERVYIPYIEKNLNRKYFNWENIYFDLRKKVAIESWVGVNPSSNQKTRIGTNNFQLIDPIDKEEEEEIDPEEEINPSSNQKTPIETNKDEIFYPIDKEEEEEIDPEEEINPSSNQKTPIGTNNDQLIDPIYKQEKDPFNQNPEINQPNSPNSFFDWMGMNEQILNRPISNLELWFFPEFVRLFNVYKTKPWIIPSKLLLLNSNLSETDNKKKNIAENKNLEEEDSTKSDMKKGTKKSKTNSEKKSKTNSENQSETDSENQSETDSENQSETNSENQSETDSENQSETDSEKKSETDSENQSLSRREVRELFMKKYFLLQLRWDQRNIGQNIRKNVRILSLPRSSINLETMTISCIDRRKLQLNVMWKSKRNLSILKFFKNMRVVMDRLGLSVKNNGQFLMYQTIGISLVHKSKNKTNQQYRKQRIIRARENNHFDALVLENILSSRRRRELRILICFNSNNWNDVDTNSVFFNENGVKNCSHFWEERNPRDKEKNELIQFKFFLWPNYRLEDLACMNRYWFDTNNGSRFSILRIHMYLPLKIR
uniref:hypothetical chloroplast RF19 n=1 Tax=Argyreia velutina TaxID=2847854 RepID=UPI001EDE1675|nr:hypothetical chloroplast RF19 [Argyreia velutina]YP_010273435.1 hypothetical chloroplast RF19 [Argyreia velutina]UKO31829.1 hypothetical chloroplast RF19 [Argyreia velutina]UKO31843.1 hypothetical chloroplast RF19 [Argyreia velutina]